MTKLPENCPICGKKMEKGYLRTGGAIYGGQIVKWRTPEMSRYRGVVKLGSGLISVDLGGVRCKNCKIVLFGYGEEEVDPTKQGLKLQP